MPDSPPFIKSFKPFLMCNETNYEVTKAFYEDLGFTKTWDDNHSACCFATGFGEQHFLITLHYGIEPQPGMLHFHVEDAQAWYEYMVNDLKLEERHPAIKITPPVATEWGWYITYVADPCGLKLHFAEPYSESNKKFFKKE